MFDEKNRHRIRDRGEIQNMPVVKKFLISAKGRPDYYCNVYRKGLRRKRKHVRSRKRLRSKGAFAGNPTFGRLFLSSSTEKAVDEMTHARNG